MFVFRTFITNTSIEHVASLPSIAYNRHGYTPLPDGYAQSTPLSPRAAPWWSPSTASSSCFRHSRVACNCEYLSMDMIQVLISTFCPTVSPNEYLNMSNSAGDNTFSNGSFFHGQAGHHQTPSVPGSWMSLIGTVSIFYIGQLPHKL
jgi:hypothetical protein